MLDSKRDPKIIPGGTRGGGSIFPHRRHPRGQVGLTTYYSSNNRRNQFRPRPGGKQGTTSYQLRQYAEATLGGGSLRKIVKLPEGEDENEWYAVNSKSTLPYIHPLNDIRHPTKI